MVLQAGPRPDCDSLTPIAPSWYSASIAGPNQARGPANSARHDVQLTRKRCPAGQTFITKHIFFVPVLLGYCLYIRLCLQLVHLRASLFRLGTVVSAGIRLTGVESAV